MEFAVFLFFMAIMSALQGYWIYILLVLAISSGCGCWRACSKGCCPKKGAWAGFKLALLIVLLFIPALVTILMAM